MKISKLKLTTFMKDQQKNKHILQQEHPSHERKLYYSYPFQRRMYYHYEGQLIYKHNTLILHKLLC